MACLCLPLSLNSYLTPDAFLLVLLLRDMKLFSRFFFSRECVTLVGRKCQIHDNILSVHSRVLQPQQLTGTQGLYALKVCCFNHFRIWSMVARRIVLSLLIHPLSLLSDIIPLKVSKISFLRLSSCLTWCELCDSSRKQKIPYKNTRLDLDYL